MAENGMGETPSLRLHGVAPESIVDGPGLRFAVFVQGCPHHCPGCHNPASHDPAGGYAGNAAELLTQFDENPLLAGITLSGGEPFAQPVPLVWLARKVKNRGRDVVVFTGYPLETLQEMAKKEAAARELLHLTDMLVDGPYVEALRDLELLWRGSSNQRIWRRKGNEFHLENTAGTAQYGA